MGQAEAILDFGSSKVVCMVGKCSDTGRFEIYGIGSCEHKGLKKGRFLDEPGLRVAVQKTIDAAQTEARRHIRTVHVGVPGPFVKVQCGECELRISDTPVEITHRDIDRLMEKAVEESVSVEGYTRALSVPFHYEVDGSARSSIPIGVTGSVLKAEISHSYIESGFEDFCTQLLDEMGIEVATFIDAASAEATMLIPEKDMDVESIVADVGYYHTDVLIMRDSACVYRTTLPVGGVHIANDVTYVLGISPAVAENIKQRHAFGLDYTDRVDTYRLTDGTAESIVYEEIQDIIEARANEIGRMVRKAVLAVRREGAARHGAVPGGRRHCHDARQQRALPARKRLPDRDGHALDAQKEHAEFCLGLRHAQLRLPERPGAGDPLPPQGKPHRTIAHQFFHEIIGGKQCWNLKSKWASSPRSKSSVSAARETTRSTA